MRLPCSCIQLVFCMPDTNRWTMVKFSLDHGLLIVGPRLRYRWTMVQRLIALIQSKYSV